MSVITLAELFSGVARSTNREKAEQEVRRIISEVRVLGIYEAICRIAATALAHQLTLCSQNRKHFERVEGLKLLSL